jgi:hypothetical protein
VWQLVEQSADRHGWVGLLGDERVGFVDVEIDGERGGIASTFAASFVVAGLANGC